MPGERHWAVFIAESSPSLSACAHDDSISLSTSLVYPQATVSEPSKISPNLLHLLAVVVNLLIPVTAPTTATITTVATVAAAAAAVLIPTPQSVAGKGFLGMKYMGGC